MPEKIKVTSFSIKAGVTDVQLDLGGYSLILPSDVDTQKYIYDSICEKVILKYDSNKLGIDDVTTDDEFADG